MKLLILLITIVMAVNLFAADSYKVSVRNEINNREFGASFKTEDKANAWIDRLLTKAQSGKGWGFVQRVLVDYPTGIVTDELKNRTGVTSQQIVVVPEQPERQEDTCSEYDGEGTCIGEITTVTIPAVPAIMATEYTIPQEFKFWTGTAWQSQRAIEDLSAEVAAAEAELAEEEMIAQARVVMDMGKNLIALFGIRNRAKGLSKGQIKQLDTNLKDIKSLLESGSLITVRDEIVALTADGVLITEEDKTVILTKLDKYLAKLSN